MKPVPQWLVIVLLVAALAGFADASYLTAEHVRGTVPPCTILNGCNNVLTSKYAAVAGVPLSVAGMLYYGTMLVLLMVYLDTRNRRVLHWACWLTGVGMLASLYFIYVQGFIIGAWCLYCLGSAFSSTVLFVTGVKIMRID